MRSREALVSEADLSHLFELAASRVRELLDARVALIQLPTADGAGLTVAAASGEDATRLLGLRLEQRDSKAGRTLMRRRAERIDSLIDDPEVDQSAPPARRRKGGALCASPRARPRSRRARRLRQERS